MSVFGTYTSILRRQARLIALVTLLVTPLFYLFLISGRDTWTSTTVLQFGTSSVAEGILGQSRAYEAPAQRLATELEIVQSNAVADRAAALLRDGLVPIDASELAARITARPRGSSTLIEIQGQGRDAVAARDLTAAWSQGYIAYRSEAERGELERVEDDLRTRLQASETELATLDAAGTLGGSAERQRAAALTRYQTVTDLLERVRLRLSVDTSGVEVLSPPTTPNSPDRPLSAPASAVAALFGALLLGGGLAVVVDLLRDPVRTRQEAEDISFLPVVGELRRPASRREVRLRAALTERNSPVALEARALRLRLDQLVGERFRDLVVITGTSSDLRDAEWTAAHLAAACGRADQRALLIVDEDRATELTSGVDSSTSGGVVRLPDRLVATPSVLGGVHVTPLMSTVEDRPGLLDTRSPTQALREATGLFDVVLLVEPPREGIDTVAPLADVVVLVCALGHTPARQLSQRVAELERTCEGHVALSLVASAPGRSLRGDAAEPAVSDRAVPSADSGPAAAAPPGPPAVAAEEESLRATRR